MSDVREENIARHHADRGNERAGPNCSLQSMVLRPFHHERETADGDDRLDSGNQCNDVVGAK